jgi:hypothetical protein
LQNEDARAQLRVTLISVYLVSQPSVLSGEWDYSLVDGHMQA